MSACMKAMQNRCSTSAMCAEAAAFVCALFVLGSAIHAAESIFVFTVGILAVIPVIRKQ